MNEALNAYLAEKKEWFDDQLAKLFDHASITPKLKNSMLYSIKAGGKRIRPILLFATLHSFGRDEKLGLKTALGLEMIHTYSLIHDDLPAMDNDTLRRGQPTNHVVYGDGTAVLAGDGLLTAAFQMVADDQRLDAAVRVALIGMLAKAAGPEGMVGGQEDDLEAEGKLLHLEELMSIHKRKTGALIRFPVEAAAIIAEATELQTEALIRYSEHLGLAFQIGDDILDVVGDEEALGKTIGSDLANKKNTYVSLLRVDGAKEKLAQEVKQALANLKELGFEDGLLGDLARYLEKRTH
ncbi:polyprenyl synthetase family protein [Sporolactobacillus inulinus]|uniref:Farnesyl diphosphate synthase n=2 Tax=Sporolactobacillus inulinus TaxID=2078 RepID=A0A0U1QS73_9BACL|nr:farnesyl diphosphate synthase [Sporolactobacillus inulinus]KLI03650.1 geranyl transferase [Sporolactobacillus inulinus CASD]GEB76501.1 farnesyl-diphosphate synthase [Sporolactobacillus inulinus]